MTGTAPPPSTGASRAVLVADDSAVAREKLRQVLRGRDPFADEVLGQDFRRIAGIVFDAVVAGRDAEAEPT